MKHMCLCMLMLYGMLNCSRISLARHEARGSHAAAGASGSPTAPHRAPWTKARPTSPGGPWGGRGARARGETSHTAHVDTTSIIDDLGHADTE
jgi:hypothetical protein